MAAKKTSAFLIEDSDEEDTNPLPTIVFSNSSASVEPTESKQYDEDRQDDRQDDRQNDEDEYEQDEYENEEEVEFQNERDYYARASYGRGGASMSIAEGMNPRMYYAIQNQDRTESDLFLDKLEDYYREVQSGNYVNRDRNQFTVLLSKHPHPRFLHIPLCMIMEYFFNGKEYKWDETIFTKLKNHTNFSVYDVLRYIALFNLYAL